jgi:hypothetical protein
MQERKQLFFGLRFAGKRFHHSVTRTKIELHFGEFFHQMKGAPANRKTAFYANREPNKQEDWIQFCMKRIRTLTFFKIFKSENKKLKTYSG